MNLYGGVKVLVRKIGKKEGFQYILQDNTEQLGDLGHVIKQTFCHITEDVNQYCWQRQHYVQTHHNEQSHRYLKRNFIQYIRRHQIPQKSFQFQQNFKQTYQKVLILQRILNQLTILITSPKRPSQINFCIVLSQVNCHKAENSHSYNITKRKAKQLILANLTMLKGGRQHHSSLIKSFAIGLLIAQISIIVLFGVFVRLENNIDKSLNSDRYPAYQDVNVMMLIGFGYLMAFSKTTSWSAFSYTFFMNALMPQLYILLNGFWKRVLVQGFHSDNYYIYINEETFVSGLYSAASMFVNIGCTIGRIGPQQIFIMCLIHEVGYTLNEVICYDIIKGFDVGGSMVIHTFGAYGGLTVSLFLSSLTRPNTKPSTNYTSNIFAFIGTLFLWMFWPSFNYGVLAVTPFAKTQIISNTIMSLTGSCLAAFMTSAFLKDKFTMEHLLNATLSGGVVIGAAAGILFNPGGALAIGFLIGIISTLGYQYLTPYLQQKIGLYDTCGVHNLHGIPGFIGGFISAIAAAVYTWPSTLDAYTPDFTNYPQLQALLSTPYKQGGLQVAITFCSLGIGVVTAIVTGLVLMRFYSWNTQEFFNDSVYFDEADQFLRLEQFHPQFVKKEVRALATQLNLQVSDERLRANE